MWTFGSLFYVANAVIRAAQAGPEQERVTDESVPRPVTTYSRDGTVSSVDLISSLLKVRFALETLWQFRVWAQIPTAR